MTDLKRWTRRLVVAAAVGLLWVGVMACESEERARARQEAMDTLTRRQKDSLISTMPIPGAGAVGKALRVQDSAKARAARIDSVIRN